MLGLCLGSDATAALESARSNYQTVGMAVQSKGLPEDDALMIDFAAIATDMKAFESFISQVDANGTFQGAPAACGIIEMANAVAAKLGALGNTYATRFNEPNPAVGLKGAGGLSTLFTVALVLGGVYVGYRILFGKSILELFSHGSDDYPKAKLPRYAGGRRRLA